VDEMRGSFWSKMPAGESPTRLMGVGSQSPRVLALWPMAVASALMEQVAGGSAPRVTMPVAEAVLP
jgi:hypothetical protein